ncbi:MAG: hypothetical protein ACT4OK_04735 [Gemmobacter sp.]
MRMDPGHFPGLSRGHSVPGLTTGTPVRVSPSRLELRRTEPTVSFQVTAPGATGFDVIVATDPALFAADAAHRRTPKNFRSSRQDFQGAPIEIEIGFYLLPRAFVRDLVSASPLPTHLYYVAAAYAGDPGQPMAWSVPPKEMARAAPHIAISADLVTANLSKVMGMAVDRLGAVNTAGRVMAVQPTGPSIGGLPVSLRAPALSRAQAAPAAPGWRVQPGIPAQGSGMRALGSAAPAARPQPPMPRSAAAPPAPARPSQKAFVDEDYAYGGGSGQGFRDLDHAAPAALGFDYDDGFDGDPAVPAAPPAAAVPPPASAIPPLDPGPSTPSPVAEPAAGAEDRLVQAVMAEGAGGRYDALNLDGGFRGRLGTADPYYQRAHDGLRIGPHQAGQDTGELGELLHLMRAADPAAFARVFGAEGEALLSVAGAAGPSGLDSPGGRGPRVQPVAGIDLWEEPWIARFREAARHGPFQAAMRAQIVARRLDPIEPALEALGLGQDRGRAMGLVLALHRGIDGAIAHLRGAANPFETPARLGAALDALGHVDLEAFRHAAGLPPGDQVDDATHFALVAALRGLGPDSPMQVPDAEGVMDAIVTTAGPGTLGDALLKLRVSPVFGGGQGA